MTFKKTALAALLALNPLAAQADADWTGAYGGLSFGMGELTATGAGTDDYVSMGIHVGYMHDFGDFVVGAELEHARNNFGGGGLAAGFSSDATRFKLRAGYDMGEFLPYGVVGVSSLDIGPLSDTATVYGLGLDYQMTPRLRLGAEYLVEDGGSNFGGSGTPVKVDSLNVRLSLNF